MKITAQTKINDLITQYPYLIDYLVELSPRFSLLKNPIARKTVGSVATLTQAAAMGGMDIEELIKRIVGKIAKESGTTVLPTTESGTDTFTESKVRQDVLKEIIHDLHAGAELSSVKKRFQEIIQHIDPLEISKLEQRLIDEGMPVSEVRRLCDVHVQVFQEALKPKPVPQMPPGHPVHTLMLENRATEEILTILEGLLQKTGEAKTDDAVRVRGELLQSMQNLQLLHRHYLRKENQLFPILEKQGVSGPSQVMWSLHDAIRGEQKRLLREIVDHPETLDVPGIHKLVETIRSMIYKEEHILYPVALELLSEEDWGRVRHGEEEIGYAWVKPTAMWPAVKSAIGVVESESAFDQIKLDTGTLSTEQINLLLKSLPLDLSFVNKIDEVVYYSDTAERVFPRSAGVIGRKVQQCHPPESVHVVQQILDDFRSGKRSVAEFWIQSKGNFIHIRYYALRDGSGNYKGCLEVTQNVTGIRGLAGEKRLLDA